MLIIPLDFDFFNHPVYPYTTHTKKFSVKDFINKNPNICLSRLLPAMISLMVNSVS